MGHGMQSVAALLRMSLNPLKPTHPKANSACGNGQCPPHCECLWGDSWSRVTGRSGRSDMADQVIDGRLRTSLVQESFQPEVTSQSILSGEDETRQSQDGVLPAVNARGETRPKQRRADSCLPSCVRLLQIMYIRARISGRQGPPPVPKPTVFGLICNSLSRS